MTTIPGPGIAPDPPATFPLQRARRLVRAFFKAGARAYRGPLARIMRAYAMLLLTTTVRTLDARPRRETRRERAGLRVRFSRCVPRGYWRRFLRRSQFLDACEPSGLRRPPRKVWRDSDDRP